MQDIPSLSDPALARDAEEHKDLAALGYIWILSVFVYVMRKESPFIRFHARQGIVLFVASIVVWVVPVVGKLLELIVLGLAVLGFLSAAQGQYRALPLVYAVSKGDWGGVRSAWKDIVQAIVDLWYKLPFVHGSAKKKEPQPEETLIVPSDPSQDSPPPSA